MRRSETSKRHLTPALRNRRRRLRRLTAMLVTLFGLAFSQFGPGMVGGLAAASFPLTVSVGYMDTHSVAFSSKQPNPWPYTDPKSFIGSPCSDYKTGTNCWDASAIMLTNPGSTNVTGVSVKVVVTTHTYALWGSNLTVQAHGMLVLTETGKQNSENFDLSDFPPNSYNGGNKASCVNSGAIPKVKITIAGVKTTFKDSGQILNAGGVDSGHCVNGTFVTTRVDESHPWVQIS